jgi:hypothetical protein
MAIATEPGANIRRSREGGGTPYQRAGGFLLMVMKRFSTEM